jgi:hypothetical protein
MTPISNTSKPTRKKGRVASWFFWGTITMMTLGTVGLYVASSKHPIEPPLLPAVHDTAPSLVEMTAEEFRKALEGAPDVVLDQVLPNIQPLLDIAFQPVYDRIKNYTNFHYSIRGEYTELVGAAVGTLEDDLERRLFAGLSDRLNSVSSEMDKRFLQNYERVLDERIKMASDSVDLGDATLRATQDAVQRVQVTAPVVAATTVAGAVSIKVISKAVAKKIVTKVAAKAAGKGLMKGGTALTGAGAGALVCAPAGPFAAVCGVGGAVVVWLTVDAVVIQLDEMLNREEFEQNLRDAIDDEKDRVRLVLTQQLRVKQLELIRMAPQQAQDLTLAQLASAQRLEICETADSLSGNYRMIQSQIVARSPRNLALFASDLDDAAQIETLRPLVDDMRASVDGAAALARIDSLHLQGNFRTNNRANRDVTAQLLIQGTRVNFERMKASKAEGFSVSSPSDIRIDTLHDVSVLAAMEQHLRIRSNRFYGGHIDIAEILSSIEDVNGLQGTVRAFLPLVLDESAQSIADVHKPQGESSILELAITIIGEPLRDPVPFSACAVE